MIKIIPTHLHYENNRGNVVAVEILKFFCGGEAVKVKTTGGKIKNWQVGPSGKISAVSAHGKGCFVGWGWFE